VDVGDTQIGILVDEVSYNLLSEEFYSGGTFKVKKGNRLVIYELKEQELNSNFQVSTTSDSIFYVSIELSYYLVKDSVLNIHNRYGESYQSNFIEPEVKRVVRDLSRLNTEFENRVIPVIDSLLLNRGFMLTNIKFL
jgi:hypothetical protein